MKEVYIARDTDDARLMRDLLITEGIHAVVRGEPLSLLGISIPIGRVFPSVWVVQEGDFERARGMVEALLKDQGEEAENAKPWECSRCGEALEGQFAECWRCGAARE